MNEVKKNYDKDNNKKPKDVSNIELNKYQINLLELSPKRRNTKKRLSQRVKRYNSISINNQNALMIKEIALFGPSKYVDLNIVKYLDNKNQKFMEELNILNKNNKYRDGNEKERVFNFLMKNHLKKIVAKDLEYFNININKYVNYILDYISLKEYGYLDIIYHDNNEPDNFYFLLNDSNVGEYSLNMINDDMDFESYFLYLHSLYKLYQKYKQKRDFLHRINKYDSEGQKNFVDSHLIKTIMNENELVYPIYSFSDVKDALEIIIKSKIYDVIVEIEKENENLEINEIDKKYIDKIIQIHNYYKVDLNILNYNKVVNQEIKSERYYDSFKKALIDDKSTIHYLKLLNNKEKHQIKKINYQKINIYHKFDYFGNFEYSPKNKDIITRKFITRSEKESTLVLCFNKFTYCNIISNLLDEEKEKSMAFLHEEFIFKEVNMEYFMKKIFSNFKLKTSYKDDIIFYQNMDNRNLIFLKEGIIELKIKNTSLLELGQKILSIRELLIKKSKVYNIENNELLKNVLKLEMDDKTSLQVNTLKEMMDKKINITFSDYTKGSFGEYECFFNIQSLLTGIVFSESCEYYVYPFEKYKKLNINLNSLNDKLKKYAFNKLINLLKRMYSMYNAYWRILNNQFTNLVKDDENDNTINLKSNENIANYNNNLYNTTTKIDDLNNNKIESINIDNNYTIKENINLETNNVDDSIKLNMASPFISHTLYGEKLKETINFNNTFFKNNKIFESGKNNKFIIKNFYQTNPRKEKKIKIKQWDFSWQEKGKYNFTERSTSNNFGNLALLKLNSDNSRKNSPKNNKKDNKMNLLNKSNKINKSKLFDIILPPLLKENNKIDNSYNIQKYFGLRSYKNKRNNTNNDRYFNNDNKQKNQKNYFYTSYSKKKKKINYDIKKVSINFLKSRRNRINLYNNKELNDSLEQYY